MVEAAMRLSAAEGFHGRVAFGPDATKENLIYLELPLCRNGVGTSDCGLDG